MQDDRSPPTPEPKTPLPRRRRVWPWVALGVALLPLLALNLWLNVFAAQSLSTERLTLEWSRAWAFHPWRVHARDLTIRQRARVQDWQLTVDAAVLGLRPAALTRRHLHFDGATAQGVEFQMRRRYAEEVDLEALDATLLPPIGDLPLAHRETGPRPERRHAWRVTLEDVDLRGVRDLWVDEMRLRPEEAVALGRVHGTADFVVRGPMRLDQVAFELEGGALEVGGAEAMNGVEVQATIDLDEVPIPSLRTVEALEALRAELEIAGDVPSLRFLRALLPDGMDLQLEGAGELAADLRLDGGALLEDSSLAVTARDLELQAGWLDAKGRGTVVADVSRARDGEQRRLDLRVDLAGLRLASSSTQPLDANAGELDLVLTGLDPRLDRPLQEPRLRLEVPELEFPDLAAFQDLLPEGLGVDLLGGRATLTTRIDLERGDRNHSFEIAAEDVQLRFRGTDLTGRFVLDGRTAGDAKTRQLAVEQVELDFDGATRPAGAGAAPVPVALDLELDRLLLSFPERGRPGLVRQTIRLRGDLDDLGWWATPLAEGRWVRLGGEAELEAEVRVTSGGNGRSRLRAPSSADLRFPKLDLGLSSWSTEGEARLEARLVDGGSGPRGELRLVVDDPVLEHPEHTSFQLPTLELSAEAPSLSSGDGLVVTLDAESTRPFELTALNAWVPSDTFAFRGGSGVLAGRLDWTPKGADAVLRLAGGDTAAVLLDQDFTGRLSLDVELASVAETELLSISRGQLRLEEVDFPGARKQDGAWWVVADLREGEVSPRPPLELDAQVQLRLRDTAPIVQMLGETRRMVRWFSRLLDIEDIDGTARLQFADGGAQLRDVDIRGQGLGIVGEIDLRPPGRALLLIDYRHLRAGFEKIGETRDVKVVRPKRWFDEKRAEWE